MSQRQPMPKQGKTAIPPIVERYFSDFRFSLREETVDAVLCRLRERSEEGLKTYGTLLHTQNGRNAIQDALEECLDAVVYLTQAIQERIEEGLGDDDRITELRHMRTSVALTSLLLTFILEEEKQANDGQ